MKSLSKKAKMIILTIIVILGLWVGLMAVDSYRFLYSEYSLSGAENHKPLITLSSKEAEDEAAFTGLGYTVKAQSDDGEFVNKKIICVFGLDLVTIDIVQ